MLSKERHQTATGPAKGSPHKYRGKKPSYFRATLEGVLGALDLGRSVSQIARDHSLSRQTVMRIRDEPEQAEAALRRWQM